MKKIGITCDEYKLKKFEEELTAKGFTDFKVFKLPHNTKLIQVLVKEEDFKAHAETIRRLCVRLEYHFKRSG